MILNIVILIAGFLILVQGASWLISGASGLARRTGISELAIGLTVVAFGSSLPELMVSLFASFSPFEGRNGIVYGNVIGSNIFNILFVLGIAGAIFPLAVKGRTVLKEIPFSMFATALLMILVNDSFVFGSETNVLGRIDGLILLVVFIVYLVYMYRTMKQEQLELNAYVVPEGTISVGKISLFLIIGTISLGLGGYFVVGYAVKMATAAGWMDGKLIGLTIIAAGTALPELVASAVAAYRKKSDFAVGNIIGSNIFNILFILGTSVLITPANFDLALNMDMALLILATFLLMVTMFTGKIHSLDRWEAILMFSAYAAYVVFLFWRN